VDPDWAPAARDAAGFLTAEQQRRYGRYVDDPDQAQLDRYFHLDAADRELVDVRRGEHNRLGFAVQIGTVRYLGTFLADPTDVPWAVAAHLAAQLGITDPAVLKQYAAREGTNRLHAGEIQQAYGYRDFADPQVQQDLTGWLEARTRLASERPGVLFDLATARLLEAKVLLPGPTVLARLVASIRDQAATQLWQTLAAAPDAEQRARLESLLVVPAGERSSTLDRLRRGPTSVTAAGLLGALHRLEEIRGLGVGGLDLTFVPPGRLEALARYATTAKAQAVARMSEQRRTATLLAAARHLETAAGDDALDLLDQLLGGVLARADRAGVRERLRTLPALDLAAAQLRDAVKVLLDPPAGGLPAVWAAIGRTVSREQLAAAVEAVDATTRPAADTHLDDLLSRYGLVRRFLPTLLATLHLEAAPGGTDVLAAWKALRDLEGRRSVRADEVPMTLATGPWAARVATPDGALNRPAYTFLVLERLRESLRRRDVYAPISQRWADPRAQLLDGKAWEGSRTEVATSLGHDLDPHRELAELAADLDGAYRAVADRLEHNDAVRIETIDGHDRPVLTALDKLDEPPSLLALRVAVDGLLPRVDLPDVLLEVAGWTGFLSGFTHVSEGAARADDLGVSICAVLVAEACNIGLEPVVQASNPALSRPRLSWVDQNYIRGETITAATARFVNAQGDIPLAQAWGGGEVASADGLRFVVPVRTLNAGPNPRYFGPGRGVTYLNFLSDQFAGFHAIVVPGTLRDSLYILDGLLEQQTNLAPHELMTDTAGYSDQVFGLFRLLGYQFSPRLADIGTARFWRIARAADYGPLNGLGRHQINTNLIATHWDDLLRVAGSLATGTVRASELLRVLQGGGRPTPLGRAVAELGRITKTLYLLAYLDDETYRRRILTQLNRTESRHSLARAVFHGQRGQLRQRYREGQEDQLGALGLVINAIVLWNTRYQDAALHQLRRTGFDVRDDDVQRLSPLGYDHINLLGRYQFSATDLTEGQLRPLRNPTAPEA
jgi:TnpA family transposase